MNLELLMINMVIGLLDNYIKNPASVAAEKNVIHNIAVASTQADEATGDGTWVFTPTAK